MRWVLLRVKFNEFEKTLNIYVIFIPSDGKWYHSRKFHFALHQTVSLSLDSLTAVNGG